LARQNAAPFGLCLAWFAGAFGIYVSLLLGLVKRCIIGYIFNKPISSLHEKDPVI